FAAHGFRLTRVVPAAGDVSVIKACRPEREQGTLFSSSSAATRGPIHALRTNRNVPADRPRVPRGTVPEVETNRQPRAAAPQVQIVRLSPSSRARRSRPWNSCDGGDDGSPTTMETDDRHRPGGRGRPGWRPRVWPVWGEAPRRQSDERISFLGAPRSFGN